MGVLDRLAEVYDAHVRLCLSETAALALCIGLYVFQQIEGLVNNTAGISPEQQDDIRDEGRSEGGSSFTD